MNKPYRKYAFWKYDQFPFVMGGEVSRFVSKNGESLIETINLGTGYWIKPLKIVDLSVGLKTQEKLDNLTARRAQFLKTANDLFNLELNAINAGFV